MALRHTAEGVIAFTIREYQSLTGLDEGPLKVELPWDEPRDLSEYTRIFQCPIQFNAPRIAVLLKSSQVERKVVTSDYKLLRILLSHAEEKSAEMDRQRGFASTVKGSIVRLVKIHFPTSEEVAGHLNVSVRTLQRRLGEENRTYKEVLEELKKDLAFSYLKRPELSLGEIAHLLDYSELSAFTRSFKRWTGQSPTEFRMG